MSVKRLTHHSPLSSMFIPTTFIGFLCTLRNETQICYEHIFYLLWTLNGGGGILYCCPQGQKSGRPIPLSPASSIPELFLVLKMNKNLQLICLQGKTKVYNSLDSLLICLQGNTKVYNSLNSLFICLQGNIK